MAISAQSLYVQLGRLAENMPDLSAPPSSAIVAWLGRAEALVSELDSTEGSWFKSQVENLLRSDLNHAREAAKAGFFRALGCTKTFGVHPGRYELTHPLHHIPQLEFL